jgi:hypothetical protein
MQSVKRAKFTIRRALREKKGCRGGGAVFFFSFFLFFFLKKGPTKETRREGERASLEKKKKVRGKGAFLSSLTAFPGFILLLFFLLAKRTKGSRYGDAL